VGAAVATLQTARRLDELPATGEALRAGKLSEVQAREIARAATAGCERRLLDAAGTCGVARLREQCHQANAAGSAERDRDEAIRQSRYLRHWSGADGAFRLDLRTTAEAGATITAALAPLHQRLVREARAAGRADSEDALAADALVALAMTAGHGSGSSGPRAMVHVRVDADVLIRGYADGNETCEVPGVGPLSGASARALTQDAIVKAVITRGVDVVGVAHLGRTVTAAQRTALEERDATCVVQGCGVRHELEIDHVDGWVVTHTTTLARLARLCRWHHYLKTHCGYLLDGRPGQRRWLPPPDRT
jgi:hypothetical protein